MDSMNPNRNESPGLSLPAPVAETGAPTFSAQENGQKNPETGTASAEKSTAISPPAMVPVSTNPAPQITPPQAQSTTNDDVTKSSKGVVSKVIEDKDLIEKEWVEKAKAIINQNRDNPYKQTEDITGVKAEYLEKNYNKSIKLSK
jgi:hypothetical protein